MIPLFDTKPEEPRNTNSAQINKIAFVHLMPLQSQIDVDTT